MNHIRWFGTGVFACSFALLLAMFWSHGAQATMKQVDAPVFSWDNATVYFVLTDRFLNGDTSNDHSYGRELDQHGVAIAGYENKKGRFQGGDLRGLTIKLNEGYFTDLGVNAIWITSPIEQIYGWYGGNGYRHYGYHGYYALDFTELDRNMGTRDELRAFIDTAHSKGIRVLFDVVLNHAGYADFYSMRELQFGESNLSWFNYYFGGASDSEISGSSYRSHMNTTSTRWTDWWGPSWLRSSFAGYDPCGPSSNDLTMCLSGLPDFKTESTATVDIPQFLKNKWGPTRLAEEQAELNDFFQTTKRAPTVRNHLIKWLTDWVREYGIDGFRIDTAKHVEMAAWKELKDEAVRALRDWKRENPHKKLDDQDFWMTGEVWGQGVTKNNYFTEGGFDSLINFSFSSVPKNMAGLDAVYSSYAASINSDSTFNMLSYISSHDTELYARADLLNGGTALLLAPGAVKIYYGDETARPLESSPSPLRSKMNWSTIDQSVLQHWQKLGQFRNRHLAIGAGTHQKIADAPYTFSRVWNNGNQQDRVVVVIGAKGSTSVPVASLFPDGTLLRDFYTGNTATVSAGRVTFSAHANGVILIEPVEPDVVLRTDQPPLATLPTVTGAPQLWEQTETELHLSWVPVRNDARMRGYVVYRDGQRIARTTLNYFTDRELLSDREYSYQISTYDANGNESNLSPVAVLTTAFDESEQAVEDNEPPQAPTELRADSLTATSVRLQWTAVIDVRSQIRYEIYRDGQPIAQTTTSNWLITDLQAGRTYIFSVRALDDAGNQSAPSNQLTISTIDNVAPQTPANLRASEVGQTSLRLNWSAAQDNVGVVWYELYLDGTYLLRTAQTSAQINGLRADTLYRLSLTALDGAQNRSARSPVLTIRTNKPPVAVDRTAPTTPVGLLASRRTSSGFTAEWRASTDNISVTGYHVYLNGKWLTTTRQTTYVFTGLSANSRHIVRIAAVDARNNVSKMSEPLTISTDRTPPSRPGGLRSQRLTGGAVRVDWAPATDNVRVTGYQIFLNNRLVSTVNSPTFTFRNLTIGTRNSVTVRAIDGAKNVSPATTPLIIVRN